MTRLVVLGIGNVLLTDDGAGVHAARRLAERVAAREDVRVLDAGTLSFTLAPVIESADRLIVLDAMELGEPPGSVRHFLDDEVDRLLTRGRLSVHEVGLRDVLAIARLSDRLPRERALIGIQPESLDWGTEPSACVAPAIEQIVGLALRLLAAWPHERPAGGPCGAPSAGTSAGPGAGPIGGFGEE